MNNLEYKETRDSDYIIRKGDQLHRGDGVGFWYTPLPGEIGQRLGDCQPANVVRYKVLSKRLCDLNECGVPLETCFKAQELAGLLGINNSTISYFANIEDNPFTIIISQPSTGLNIEVYYLEPDPTDGKSSEAAK